MVSSRLEKHRIILVGGFLISYSVLPKDRRGEDRIYCGGETEMTQIFGFQRWNMFDERECSSLNVVDEVSYRPGDDQVVWSVSSTHHIVGVLVWNIFRSETHLGVT